MPIQVSDEDFAAVLSALRLACSGYSEDEIEAVMLGERKALRIMESYT